MEFTGAKKAVPVVVTSNFTISLVATVHVDRDAGGPGFLAKVKRFPDGIEKP